MDQATSKASGELATPEVASNWSGQMTCKVINLTGEPILTIKIEHILGRFDDVGDHGGWGLWPGESFDFTINVGSGHSDYWGIDVLLDNGQTLVRHDKGCDVEQSDLDSGLPMFVIIGTYNAGFSLQLPKSSSCMGNHY